jgi:uncharacterized protein (DUF849 family)
MTSATYIIWLIFLDRGLFKPPVFMQLIFEILGGIGADIENLMFMKRTADKLFGKDYLWSVLGAGRAQMPFATQAALMGGTSVSALRTISIFRALRSRGAPKR